MKRILAALLAMLVCAGFAACAAEGTETDATCGHEPYEDLINALENKDYDAARKMIDELEGVAAAATVPAETAVPETSEAAAPVAQGENIIVDMELVSLDRQNLLDYFELREEYIFEDTVKCYQYFLLKEEYEKRLLGIEDVVIEISGFDATAYGELDQGDQLFFLSRYDMTTGELTFRKVHVTNNGEGHIALTKYDEKNHCFEEYLMDIAITEVSGRLVLKAE